MSRLAAIAVFLIAQAGPVTAAEVKVFSTIGVQAALEELAAQVRVSDRQQTRYHLGHGRDPRQTCTGR
jgi:hypothetical protein